MAAEMDATPMGARSQKGTKLLSCYRKSNIAGILIGRTSGTCTFFGFTFSSTSLVQ